MAPSRKIHAQRQPGAAPRTSIGRSYARRSPEKTVLYRVIQDHVKTFLADARERSEHGFGLPRFIEQEFERYLACGLLCHGFARVRCDNCAEEVLVPLSCKNRGVCPSCTTRRMHDTAAHLVDRVLPRAPYRQWVLSLPRRVRFELARQPGVLDQVLRVFLRAVFAWQRRQARRRGLPQGLCGSVTWIQRFGGHLNLNVHFHALVPDGVFVRAADGSVGFHELDPPEDKDIAAILLRIVGRVLALLDTDGEEGCADDALVAAQATAVIARRPADSDLNVRGDGRQCVFLEGFSLHAATHVAADDRLGLERLAKYAGRPPLALSRLRLTPDGKVAYDLKRSGRAGARQIVLAPWDFLSRLATLIPPPRRHLLRYNGVFAPNAAVRDAVVPAAPTLPDEVSPALPRAEPASLTPRRLDWATLLLRVFAIDVLRCPSCGGRRRLLAFLTEPGVVMKILEHLGLSSRPPAVAPARASPERDDFACP